MGEWKVHCTDNSGTDLSPHSVMTASKRKELAKAYDALSSDEAEVDSKK